METCWISEKDAKYEFGQLTYVPMLDGDRDALRRELLDGEEDPTTDERMEATHFGIQVLYPEDGDADTQAERDELTWHDFGAFAAKQVDGEWFIWYDDVSSTSTVWYQSTYTRVQAEAVRDLAIRLASEGRLYDDLYEVAKTEVMTFW